MGGVQDYIQGICVLKRMITVILKYVYCFENGWKWFKSQQIDSLESWFFVCLLFVWLLIGVCVLTLPLFLCRLI